MIKTKKLKVPVDAMGEVADFINENALTAMIVGTGDGDEESVVISVRFGPNERSEVHELEDLIDDRWDEFDDGEDDDE